MENKNEKYMKTWCRTTRRQWAVQRCQSRGLLFPCGRSTTVWWNVVTTIILMMILTMRPGTWKIRRENNRRCRPRKRESTWIWDIIFEILSYMTIYLIITSFSFLNRILLHPLSSVLRAEVDQTSVVPQLWKLVKDCTHYRLPSSH